MSTWSTDLLVVELFDALDAPGATGALVDIDEHAVQLGPLPRGLHSIPEMAEKSQDF